MKRIIISVSNDLYSDQRVRKVCQSLSDIGYDIQLLGRKLSDSKEITDRAYGIKRFRLVNTKGPLFYAELNFRLLVYLLGHKADVLLANDLDTLLPNYIVSKLKGIPLVYDSHEYFTEVPELKGRFAKKIWEKIEAHLFPKLKNVFTVNKSIADIYSQKYSVKINILKNLPNKSDNFIPEELSSLELPTNKNYILLQGAGINIDRGAEEIVEAMEYVKEAALLIIGSGDVLPKLKIMVKEKQLEKTVFFIEKQSPTRLKSYTYYAQIGLSMDKDTNLNYRYSLPNKIFDYIQGGVPILVSNLPEVRRVVEEFDIGLICPDHNPITIANYINQMLDDNFKNSHRTQLQKAAQQLNWENQETILRTVYTSFL